MKMHGWALVGIGSIGKLRKEGKAPWWYLEWLRTLCRKIHLRVDYHNSYKLGATSGFSSLVLSFFPLNPSSSPIVVVVIIIITTTFLLRQVPKI